MELKRYVMIGKEIFEVERVLENDVKHVYFKAVGEEYNRTIYDGDVYKTSDNILDLVEVGDLVSRNEYNKMIITEILDEESLLHDVQRSCYSIFAIYKRQPNGDYKKYEVK